MKRALSITLLVVACGSPPPPPSASPEPSAGPAPSSSPAPAPSASEEPAPEAGSAPSAAPETPAPASAESETRSVKYSMIANKLDVVIDGVRFKPSAKAIRVGGGWGVRLTVSAESEDDKQHALLGSSGGPLAFGGKVNRKGKTEDVGDERNGDEELFVSPGTPSKFERDWPGKGEKPLGAGDKLELQVGLWGLGPDAASRRPVKKFIRLTMTVDKGEPRPLIAPPS